MTSRDARRATFFFFILLVLLAAVTFLALNIGATNTTLWSAASPERDAILWTARWPRILLALLVGAALGCAGTTYQTLLRNPLADPYILGVSGGAALGSALGFTLNLPFIGVALCAFLVSFAVMLTIVGLMHGTHGDSVYRLLLTGVVTNAFAFAFILAVQNFIPSDRSHALLALLMGNLTLADLTIVRAIALPVLIGLAVLWWHARSMDAWILGHETAMSLGINVRRLQYTLFAAGSLVVGAAVAASGLIGFVGLFIPHAMRLLCGNQHRRLLPISALAGAIFLLCTDTAARSVLARTNFQSELPVGVITALIGAPCFLWLLRKRDVA